MGSFRSLTASTKQVFKMSQATPTLYGKLLLTALFWGGTWIAGRVAVQEAPPLAVASWRFLLASLILGILLVLREGRPRWSAQQALKLGALGLTGIFLYNLFFLYALKQVEAGRGALVAAFIPAVIALVDGLRLRQPMPPRKLFGITLALFGCLLVVTRGHPTQLFTGELRRGEGLLMGTVLTWVIYTLISRQLSKQFSPLAMTFGACFTGWLMLTVAALAQGSLFALGDMSLRGGSAIVFLGVFGTAISFTWYSEAIARIGTTRAAAFINLVPVFAVLLGALMLDERLGVAVLSGGVLVMAGVWLTNRSGSEGKTLKPHYADEAA
jgi:drug/metabolite transporter (DMT)-like permease